MTLDELLAFVTVAEAGGFTKASARLHRSQPAISRRIDMLEQSLGGALFDRRGRRVALTAAGESLLPHAQDALAAVKDGQRAVQACLERAEGVLTLAVVGTIADSYLVEVLRSFQADHGNVRVALQTANSREVSDLVRRGDADVGLRYFADSDQKLDCTALGSERLYVVVPADHPVTAVRCVDLRPFAEDRWLGFPETRGQPESYGSQLLSQLAAGGIEAPQVTTVDSLTAQKRLVEAGFGVALMPRRNLRDELQAGSLRLVEVGSVTARLPVVLVRRRGAPRRASVDTLLALLNTRLPALLDA